MTPKKILAIKLRSLGDTILLTAPLFELKKKFPTAQIDVMVTSQWTSILENHPAIRNIIPYNRRKHAAARAKSIARHALTLRKENYDWAINFHASPSSSLLAFATGARTRACHFHGHKDANRYSTVEIPGKGIVKPIIERDMDCLRALGLHVPEGRLPQIFLTEEELEHARSFLLKNRVQGKYICLGLGASRPTKVWPIEYFAELAIEYLSQGARHCLVIVGGSEEEHLLQEFSRHFKRYQGDPNKIIAIHQSSLREVASLLKLSSAFVGNDSGPKHMAVAVGTPTLTLMGPEDPFEWHPYPQEKHPFLHIRNLPCRKDALPGRPPWCGLEICTIEQHKCMKEITVEDAWSTLKQIQV